MHMCSVHFCLCYGTVNLYSALGWLFAASSVLSVWQWYVYQIKCYLPTWSVLSSVQTSANRTDDLTLCLVFLQQPLRILDLLPWQDLFYIELECAIRHLWQRMLYELVSELALVRFIATPQAAANIAAPLPDECADIRTLWQFGTTHETQVHNDAVLRYSLEVLLEVRCANEIDDNVYTLVIGCFHHLFDPVLRSGIECGGSAQLLHGELAFRILTSGGIDSRSIIGAGELNTGN